MSEVTKPDAIAVRAPAQHSVPAIQMTFADMMRLAQAFAASRLFGIETPDQALALMAISQAEGMHPAFAARDYHIIQGRPSLKADAMLARFQSAGGTVKWIKYDDTGVTGKFSHAQGGEVTIVWDMIRAAKSKLANKDTWQKHPREMMRARCISEGVRTVYPGAMSGMYTPEEIMDEQIGEAPAQAAGEARTQADVSVITAEQVTEIVRIAKQHGYTGKDMLAVITEMGIERLGEIPAERFAEVMERFQVTNPDAAANMEPPQQAPPAKPSAGAARPAAGEAF